MSSIERVADAMEPLEMLVLEHSGSMAVGMSLAVMRSCKGTAIQPAPTFRACQQRSPKPPGTYR